VVNLLDDILIYGPTRVVHDQRLRAVLQRLSDHHATVNVEKTVIGASEVDFDGFSFSAGGVRPTASHTEALTQLKVPTNLKELRSFLGAVGFYMKFVDHYADIVEPLRNLQRQGVEWHWSHECQEAFDTVISSIVKTTSLNHFDVHATTTIVTTDASSVALGACLSQVVNGVERPVAFASRTLQSTERNYSATEREALACLWACEHWNFFLYGRKFLLHTDHQALQVMLMAPGKGHRPLRLHRWADRILYYNPDIMYKSGERIAMADYLSRMSTDTRDTADLSTVTVSSIFGSEDIPVVLETELQAATANDPLLQMVLKYVQEGWCSRATLPAELKAYYDVRDTLSVTDDRLLTKDSVVVVPDALRTRVLTLAHEGHPGIVRMKQRCRTTVWWPGLNTAVERHVRHCVSCAVSGKSLRPTTPPLQPLDYPPRPWHTVAIDIFGEVKWAPTHQQYLVVLVDLHCKWPEVAACGTVTSSSVISVLTDLFCRHGLPDRLISDNGPQFVSAEFEQFLTSHGIQHDKTAVYNPTANGAVERFNKVLKEGLAVAHAESTPFLPAVKKILANYRSLPHATTGESPAKLMYGREIRMPLNCLLSAKSESNVVPKVQQHVRFAQDKAKEYTDRVRHAKESQVKVGDRVRTLRPSHKHKLDAKWSLPKQVVAVHNATLTLDDGRKWNVRKCIPYEEEPDFTVEFDTRSAEDASVSDDKMAATPTRSPVLTPSPCVTPPPPLRRSSRARQAPSRYSP
jgi:RNase H-like domain found in reverse transcriptase/Integrase zinc binding domain/Integrase core domain